MTGPAPQPQVTPPAIDGLLLPKFHGLSATDLLAHFRARTTPVLPVVEDATQTTPQLLRGVLDGQFTFNRETHKLEHPIDWTANPSRDIEWQILLHKFYYLVGLARHWRDTKEDAYARRAIDLLDSWNSARLPPGLIAADVDGRRIQNWVYAWSILVHAPAFPAQLNLALLARLHADVIWLNDNLHAKRNHRTLELFAIFLWSIAFPEFRTSRGLQASALALLSENALCDFKQDGSHCEQSTHYHCIVLRNFINVVHLARLNGVALDPAFEERLRAAARFALAVHRPDGEIPALSDADGGSYRDLIDMSARLLGAGRPPGPIECFPNAGLVTFRSKISRDEHAHDQRFLAFDAGPMGEGNHGHLDALSVEIFGYGSPLIVDPGRYTYDESGDINWRAAFRGTRAHSTVMVDGKDQARYEQRGRKWKITSAPPATTLHGAANLHGAIHAHGSTISSEYTARHDRHVFFFDDRYWLIIDLLTARECHNYELRYQLAPELSDAQLVHSSSHIEMRSRLLAGDVRASHRVQAQIETGWVSRQYGEKTRAPRLRVACTASQAAFATLLIPTRAEQAIGNCSLSWRGDEVVFRHTNTTSGHTHTVCAGTTTATTATQPLALEPVQ